MNSYYQNITSPQALKLEKMRVKSEIQRSSTRLTKKTKLAVLPKNQSLMQSDISYIRYAAWMITAYKTYCSIRKIFRRKK